MQVWTWEELEDDSFLENDSFSVKVSHLQPTFCSSFIPRKSRSRLNDFQAQDTRFVWRILQNTTSCGLSVPRCHEFPSPTAAGAPAAPPGGPPRILQLRVSDKLATACRGAHAHAACAAGARPCTLGACASRAPPPPPPYPNLTLIPPLFPLAANAPVRHRAAAVAPIGGGGAGARVYHALSQAAARRRVPRQIGNRRVSLL